MATRNKRELAAVNKEKLWGTSQERNMERFRNHSGTIPENLPKLDSGTIPEPFRKIYQNPIPDTLRNTYGYPE